ncbi:S-4TM family putative pore-forming effector [Streptomyces sp. CC228A]|uniref:S-4TM family putative pore-forming effector n=1 Tax=Streptomyces sp. CC228A TaxID=2898186 RepID=UPI001F32A395|nr:S-4TM family putative pore-forming effector [Streptomyces sp. CC228A]
MPTSDIPSRQNEPGTIRLLRAAAASHRQAQLLAALHLTVSAVLAGGAVLALLVPSVNTAVSLLGMLWALVYALWAAEWSKGAYRRAAVIQEVVDTELFGLPWNRAIAGDPPEAHEVSRLARRYRGDEARLRDYYEIDALPRPLDVLACQLQNLGWGTRVRRRYGIAIQWALVAWCLAGLVVGVSARMSVTDVLTTWFVPSLGLLLLGVDTYRAQRDTAASRERAHRELSERIDAYVADGSPTARHSELLELSRQVQDVLLQTRLAHVRVPDWFFDRFHGTDRADFAADLADLHRRTGV